MKKFKIKFISSLCLGIMLIPLFTISSSANEMYYDTTTSPPTAINLKWGEIVNGKAFLRINGDYLDSNYSPHFSVAVSAWNNVAGKVTTVQTSFASSTVDMATASQGYWSNRWGNEAIEIQGVCDKTSRNGENLDTLDSAKAARSKEIGYVQIYFTPANDGYRDKEGHRRKTMVHEIGHALGLGHTNIWGLPEYTEEAAVMRQQVYDYYYTPQQHDINAISRKYSNN